MTEIMIGHRINRRRQSLWRLLLAAMGIGIVLLGVYNLAVLLLRTLDRPAIPAPGQLVYVTTFDAYNEQWSQFPGQIRAEIAEGKLLITSDAFNEGAYSELDRVLSDFDLRVEARWVETPSEYGQLGVLFRYQNRDNYYMFKIRGDGAYRVERVQNGDLEVMSEWQFSPHVQTAPGTVNRLRVVGQAFLFSFYINDHLLPLCLKGSDRKSTWTGPRSGECLSDNQQTRETLFDNAFDTGKIALGAVADEPGLKVAFDNVLIVGPK